MERLKCMYCGRIILDSAHSIGTRYACPECYTSLVLDANREGWRIYNQEMPRRTEPDVDFSAEGMAIEYEKMRSKSKMGEVLVNEVCKNILDFILAGKAEFCVYQEPSDRGNGGKTWYKVTASDKYDMYFVYYKGSYLGYFYKKDIPTIRQLRQKKKQVEGVEEFGKPLCYVLRTLSSGHSLASIVHIIHNGKCSVCGRKLTDQNSINIGIGPDCLKRLKLMNELR